MGLLRLFLALSVVLSHAGSFHGFVGVGGETAVQSFFMVSGFYMALILGTKYGPDETLLFYKTRFIRIYGLYWPVLSLYVAAAGVVFLQNGAGPLASIIEQGFSSLSFVLMAFANVFLIGLDALNFLQFSDGGIAFTANGVGNPNGLIEGTIVKPAWSLGPELTFYLLAPFLLRRSSRTLLAVIAASFVFRLVASGYGVVADPWSYRFFPFELAHFLLGAMAYRLYEKKKAEAPNVLDKALVGAVFAGLLAYSFVARTGLEATYFEPANIAFLAVTFVALPSMFKLFRNVKWDRAIGELSYPVYLVHMLIVLVLDKVPLLQANIALKSIVAVGVSIGAAWALERGVGYPVERLRTLVKRRGGVDDNTPLVPEFESGSEPVQPMGAAPVRSS